MITTTPDLTFRDEGTVQTHTMTVTLTLTTYTLGEFDPVKVARNVADAAIGHAGYNYDAEADSDDLVFVDVESTLWRDVEPCSTAHNSDTLSEAARARADGWWDSPDPAEDPLAELRARYDILRERADALHRAEDETGRFDGQAMGDIDEAMADLAADITAALGWW